MRPNIAVPLIALALCVPVGSVTASPEASGAAPRRAVPTVGCEAPRLLRLDRFEDGSAKVMCGSRLLARVSVPW